MYMCLYAHTHTLDIAQPYRVSYFRLSHMFELHLYAPFYIGNADEMCPV